MRVKHDIHNHSVYSRCCHDPEATVAQYVKTASELGHEIYGLSDHMWDPSIPCAKPWYQKQPTSRGLEAKKELLENTYGMRVLMGVETEYCGMSDTLGMSVEEAKKFDYVLVPHTHLHMRGFVMADPAEGVDEYHYIADFMRDSFLSLMRNPNFRALAQTVPVSVAHSFVPGGLDAAQAKIAVGYLRDDDLAECYGLAKELGVGIEINTTNLLSPENHFAEEPMIRVLRRAKEAGCKFTFGSDAHRVCDLSAIRLADEVTDILGIVEEDVMEFFR